MRQKAFFVAILCMRLATLACVLHAPMADGATAAPRRPQDEAIAKGPQPYTNEEVSFLNEHGLVRLAGTLSVPEGRGPFPAVLLVAASGPQGRDEEVAGHRVFVVLADDLLRRKIAVLRYDKRGVGSSSGDWSNASFDDLVSDAAAAFRYLKGRAEVDRHRAGVIGHSEGGSIAPAVAVTDRDVAFIVALAGSGLSGEVRITEQQVYAAQERGTSTAEQVTIRELCRQIFQAVAATPNDAAAAAQITALIDGAVTAKTLQPESAAALRSLLTGTFVGQELRDQPVEYLKQVHVPVLALVGSLDRIVPAGPYVEVMKPVLARLRGSRVQVLPGLNHVLQTAHTGSVQEFGTIEESISPVALDVIGDWVVRQTERH